MHLCLYVGEASFNPGPVRYSIEQYPILLPLQLKWLACSCSWYFIRSGSPWSSSQASELGPDVLSKPLLILFQKLSLCSVFPDLWLESIVIYRFMGKSRYDPLNYCHVSLTSVCCQRLESIIVCQDWLFWAYSNVSTWVDKGNRSWGCFPLLD